MCALLEQMAEREYFLGAGAVRAANEAGYIRIDARVVVAVDIGPHLHRTLLQQAPQKLGSARRNRKADQRGTALGEAPAVVAEGIDPAAFIHQVAILGGLADHAQRAGLPQRRLRAPLPQKYLALEIHALEVAGRVAGESRHLRHHAAGGSRPAPHAEGGGHFLVIGQHSLIGGQRRLDDFERAHVDVPRQRLGPKAALRHAIGGRVADLDTLQPGAPHDGRDVPGGLLELGKCEPAVGFPNGADIAHGLVGGGGFGESLQKPR